MSPEAAIAKIHAVAPPEEDSLSEVAPPLLLSPRLSGCQKCALYQLSIDLDELSILVMASALSSQPPQRRRPQPEIGPPPDLPLPPIPMSNRRVSQSHVAVSSLLLKGQPPSAVMDTTPAVSLSPPTCSPTIEREAILSSKSERLPLPTNSLPSKGRPPPCAQDPTAVVSLSPPICSDTPKNEDIPSPKSGAVAEKRLKKKKPFNNLHATYREVEVPEIVIVPASPVPLIHPGSENQVNPAPNKALLMVPSLPRNRKSNSDEECKTQQLHTLSPHSLVDTNLLSLPQFRSSNVPFPTTISLSGDSYRPVNTNAGDISQKSSPPALPFSQKRLTETMTLSQSPKTSMPSPSNTDSPRSNAIMPLNPRLRAISSSSIISNYSDSPSSSSSMSSVSSISFSTTSSVFSTTTSSTSSTMTVSSQRSYPLPVKKSSQRALSSEITSMSSPQAKPGQPLSSTKASSTNRRTSTYDVHECQNYRYICYQDPSGRDWGTYGREILKDSARMSFNAQWEAFGGMCGPKP
ncbi:hypothetical protein BU17DRAFT_82993 [Hysterangium stoloniferum]|nr:hypothetical protein BU17DRAFT_82993 [Hysterangium stoloniferum]